MARTTRIPIDLDLVIQTFDPSRVASPVEPAPLAIDLVVEERAALDEAEEYVDADVDFEFALDLDPVVDLHLDREFSAGTVAARESDEELRTRREAVATQLKAVYQDMQRLRSEAAHFAQQSRLSAELAHNARERARRLMRDGRSAPTHAETFRVVHQLRFESLRHATQAELRAERLASLRSKAERLLDEQRHLATATATV